MRARAAARERATPLRSRAQTAERAAAETLAPPECLELYFVGNAPMAHFSAPARDGRGALETTWILRASVLDGGVQLAKGFSGALAPQLGAEGRARGRSRGGHIHRRFHDPPRARRGLCADFAWLTKGELQQHFPAEVRPLLEDALS